MWTKYHKKDVTNIFGNMVEHWADVDEDGEVELISESTIDYIDDKSCSNSSGDILKRGGLYTHAPYRDISITLRRRGEVSMSRAPAP